MAPQREELVAGPSTFHRNGLDIGKRSLGKILTKIQSLQCSLDQAKSQKPLDLVIPRKSLAQCPKGLTSQDENPRTGFLVWCWEKWEKLRNTPRNGAAVISREIILELDLGAVPTFHNCPTTPRALPAPMLEFWGE